MKGRSPEESRSQGGDDSGYNVRPRTRTFRAWKCVRVRTRGVDTERCWAHASTNRRMHFFSLNSLVN